MPCRAISTPSRCSPRWKISTRESKRFCARRVVAPGTSSISGMASCRAPRSKTCRPLPAWSANSVRRRPMPDRAVLLLAHGTPETADQIPEYLRNVVSGRPMPQHVIEEIQHRYSLIGRSPLTDITREQGRLVEAELAAGGDRVPVYVGMRNWRPYIPEVVKQMRADGVEEAAVICLAPQNSRTSVGLYRRAVEAEAAGMKMDFLEGWADEPLLADAFADRQ